MKKLIALALCGTAIISASAQMSTVEEAKKLAGKTDKIEQARSLIKQAIADPSTANQAITFVTAGDIEWKAYDKEKGLRMVNPDKVNPLEMGRELVNGFDYYIQVFPLDQIPDEKGKTNKYTKDLQKKISGKTLDFYEAGAELLSDPNYYPDAYRAFMIYGDMPDLDVLGDKKPVITDTVRSRAWAYYYAGRAAYSANMLNEAADAFKKARINNFRSYDENTPSAHIFEIACWQNIMNNDTTRTKEAQQNILEIAKDGNAIYGVSQPIYISNIVEGMALQDKGDQALPIISDAISQNPQNPDLLALRAWLYDYMNQGENALADYQAAVQLPNVNYDTMRKAIHKLLLTGQSKLNEVEFGDPNYKAKRDAVKDKYIREAQKLLERAKTMTDDPSSLDYYSENIEYLLGV